jgi:hypothetical protein
VAVTRSDWAIAQYLLDILSKTPGKEFHRDELSARVDYVLTRAGLQPALVDDPERFDRCMRLAKILGLRDPDHLNPFPIYGRRGYWRIQPDEGQALRAYRMALLNAKSRGTLLLQQAKSEQQRQPTPARAQSVTELTFAVRANDLSLTAVEDLIAAL